MGRGRLCQAARRCQAGSSRGAPRPAARLGAEPGRARQHEKGGTCRCGAAPTGPPQRPVHPDGAHCVDAARGMETAGRREQRARSPPCRGGAAHSNRAVKNLERSRLSALHAGRLRRSSVTTRSKACLRRASRPRRPRLGDEDDVEPLGSDGFAVRNSSRSRRRMRLRTTAFPTFEETVSRPRRVASGGGRSAGPAPAGTQRGTSEPLSCTARNSLRRRSRTSLGKRQRAVAAARAHFSYAFTTSRLRPLARRRLQHGLALPWWRCACGNHGPGFASSSRVGRWEFAWPRGGSF